MSDDSLETMKDMISSLRHRGPDGEAIYIDDWALLGHTRLSIIDPKGGRQPISNEDSSLWLTYNGEIFNYIELRDQLEKNGHHFSTNTDSEVLIHLFEDYEEQLFDHLNGQYAFAIWDRNNRRLFLGRDHVGICPLYYWSDGKKFAFASEIKALFKIDAIVPELNLFSLMQTFTFWSPLPGFTPFKNIFEIKPGCYMWVEEGSISEHKYWGPSYAWEEEELIDDKKEAIETLNNLLDDAVRLRLRSDVPVGAYLSGGLDSSIITALIKNRNRNRLCTFSIRFENTVYDETKYQKLVSAHLNTDHSAFICNNKNIAEILFEVVWHTEKPILRTAPAPLFLLSKLVKESGYKVVLTGEGADEFFSGYNIFKETKIRDFNARNPQSKIRPLLFKRLYPYLDSKNDRTYLFWKQFFRKKYLDTTDPFYSHRIRWQNGAFISQFLNSEILDQLADYDPIQEISDSVKMDLTGLNPFLRAHFLEAHIFLASYLLSSQGDRMMMGHGVEGRYPFLDRRVIEFANRLSPSLKLKGLNEKWILKKTFADMLPAEVIKRSKQPYRAPIKEAYSINEDLINECISTRKIKLNSVFASDKVSLLKKKIQNSRNNISAREEMALSGIITTEILIDQFINSKSAINESKSQWLVIDQRKDSK